MRRFWRGVKRHDFQNPIHWKNIKQTYHENPFIWSAVLTPSPIFTKSNRTKFGNRFPPNGAHPFAFAMILVNEKIKMIGCVWWMATYEERLLVVGASLGSLTITPPPIGMMFLLREWLIMYIWSAGERAPEIRSTEQGNEAFVTENGVSHI